MREREQRAQRVTAAVRDHSPALLGYFARRTAHREDAADLLAETLLILWREASRIPERDDQIRAWMFGVAHNVLLHHYRSTARRRAATERAREALRAEPHPGFRDPDEHDDLHAAIRVLSPADRDLIGLVHWEGFSLVEAAGILQLNESTVRSRYHRAKQVLKTALQETVTARSTR